MPYNFAADSFLTEKLCSRLSLNEVQFCVFEPPAPLGDLGATYDDHLRLIGGATSDYLFKIGNFTPTEVG